MIFIGAISDVKTFWSLIDIALAGIAVPHMATLVVSTIKKPAIVNENSMKSRKALIH